MGSIRITRLQRRRRLAEPAPAIAAPHRRSSRTLGDVFSTAEHFSLITIADNPHLRTPIYIPSPRFRASSYRQIPMPAIQPCQTTNANTILHRRHPAKMTLTLSTTARGVTTSLTQPPRPPRTASWKSATQSPRAYLSSSARRACSRECAVVSPGRRRGSRIRWSIPRRLRM